MNRKALIALSFPIISFMPCVASAGGDSDPAPEQPARIGPFVFSSSDGKSSIELGIAAQLLLKFESKDQGRDKDRLNTAGLEIRRLRETLAGTFLGKDLTYYMHLSTAPGSLELMDAYLNYAATPDVQIRAGQFKIPFTRYRIGSYKNLTFSDWAIVTKYFGAERQRGFAIHNGFEKPPKIEYELGLMAGQNVRASHGIGLATVYGEKVPNPSDLTSPAPAELPHLEPVLHLAYNHGDIDTSTDTDWEGGPFRFSAGASLAWDTRPTDYLDQYVRLAPEILLKFRGLSLTGIYYRSTRQKYQNVRVGSVKPYPDFLVQHDVDNFEDSIAMSGGLVQFGCLLTKRLELSGRYAVVAVADNLARDAESRASYIVQQEKDDEKKAALAKQYQTAGRFSREHELTFGANVYIAGKSLKWQNDVSLVMHEGIFDERFDDWRVRSQIQLAF